MLTELIIENFILIEKLNIKPDKGFIALTGETGAGKSILIDALALVLGARGDPKLIRKNTKNASVTATFKFKNTHPVNEIIKKNNIPIQKMQNEKAEIKIQRIQKQNGKTKAFINQIPITIALLRQCADMMVEIHGQYDGYQMNDHVQHRNMLDTLEPQNNARKNVENAWKNKINAEQKLQNKQAELENIEAQKLYLKNAITDIENLNLMSQEEKKLAQERKILMQSEQLNESLRQIQNALEASQNIPIHATLRILEPYKETQNQTFLDLIHNLENLSLNIDETQNAVRDAQNAIDASPEKLDHIQERLFLIREIARKYQSQPDDLIRLKQHMKQKLNTLHDSHQTLQNLRDHVNDMQREYSTYAQKLSQIRHQNAQKLNRKISSELPALKLADAKFKTHIETNHNQQTQYGIDTVTFLVSTNPGSDFMPLGYATSGGELSRFILAIKVCLTQEGEAPTLIFDEIDAAVGGETAHAIGKHMHKLSRNLQILAVTHSPQLAAIADQHIKIIKTKNQNGDITIRAQKLTNEQRKEEIARMLSADRITQEARAQAEQLLNVHNQMVHA